MSDHAEPGADDRAPKLRPAGAPDPGAPDPADPERVAEAPTPAAADTGELAAAVAALTEDDVAPATRRRLLGRIVAQQTRARGVRALFRPKALITWIADSVGDVAPYIPVRDLATLREHHDGLEGDALAERLIRNAARATTGIGAAGGGVAAVEWVVTPTLLSAPVLLAAETVAVVAVEVKLIGELHEVYGRPVPGTGSQRAMHLVQAWAQQRQVDPLTAGRGVTAALGTATRKELRDRLVRRFGRNLSTMGPFLTGAAVAGFLNRRSTLSLGEAIRKDLTRTPRVIEG